MKNRNILSLVIFALFIASYFFYREYQKTEPERRNRNNLNVAFSGKIDSVYTDYSNHGITIVIFKNRKKMEFNMYKYNYFQKNDSIVKHKGEDSIYVYRNGEIKTYKY